MGIENEVVGELVNEVDKGAVIILTFKTGEGKPLDVSAFEGLPTLQKGSTYRLRTTQNEKNGRTYTNLAKGKDGYLIEKTAESVPTRATVTATGPKLDAREVRISKLSCTSSACLIVSSLVEGGKIADMGEAGRQVLLLAKKLEEHIFSPEAV